MNKSSKLKGIDVSVYQANVDYKKVKSAGIDFVIIRAGYGRGLSQKDAAFETHYKNARAAGLAVGAYWYSYATDTAEAKREAETCLQIIKNKTFDFPIFYDIEEQRTFASGKTDETARTFLQTLEKAGYFAGIYISRSPATAYLSEATRNRYALWLAEYSDHLNYNGNYGIWQYSSNGKIDGINGNVDLDIAYIDYPKIIKNKNLNGFAKSKSLEQRVTELEKRVDIIELKNH